MGERGGGGSVRPGLVSIGIEFGSEVGEGGGGGGSVRSGLISLKAIDELTHILIR